MKTVIVAASVVLAVLAPSGCGQKGKPAGVSRTEIGDGVWIVGDEINPGLWEPMEDITTKKDCAWFVSPAKEPSPGASPTTEPTFRTPLPDGVIELHKGEAFTTNHCGRWHQI